MIKALFRNGDGEDIWAVFVKEQPRECDYDSHASVETVARACTMVFGRDWNQEYDLECRGAHLWYVIEKGERLMRFTIDTAEPEGRHASEWVNSLVSPISNTNRAHVVWHDRHGGSYVWRPGTREIEWCDQGYQEGVRERIPFVVSTPGIAAGIAEFQRTCEAHSRKVVR